MGALVRAYADVANELEEAGYSPSETAALKAEVDYFERARAEVKLASAPSKFLSGVTVELAITPWD